MILTLILALAAADVPPATPTGPPVACITTTGVRSTVRSDRIIDFRRGRRHWRNTLPQACPGLAFDRAIAYTLPTNRLCSVDIVTVVQSGTGLRGASCALGPFQPIARP